MANRITAALYKPIRGLVRLVYPKTKVVGAEKLPEGAAIVVGNHSQLHGPIACELYFPGRHATWCAGEMMALKEVPDYAYRDFWSGKPRAVKPFFRLASYLIAPLSVIVFNNAECIGVYRDSRVISTFRRTAACLREGRRVIIFPEKAEPGEGFLYAFQEGFVDCARSYCRQTGKGISFVPLYVAPAFHTLYLGNPVPFDPAAPIALERQRICREMTEAILSLARALPEHRVVPYMNLPKKDYPSSRDTSRRCEMDSSESPSLRGAERRGNPSPHPASVPPQRPDGGDEERIATAPSGLRNDEKGKTTGRKGAE